MPDSRDDTPTPTAGQTLTEKIRALMTQEPDTKEFILSRIAVETLLADSERYSAINQRQNFPSVRAAIERVQWDLENQTQYPHSVVTGEENLRTILWSISSNTP